MNLLHRMKKENILQRITALCLSLVMVLSLMIVGTPPTRAADWMAGYLNTLVSWGVMRGDINGNLNPERAITRAEFVTMVNRAYGYDKVGEHPFEDVISQDWYSDDIGIAYRMGYFAGTSESTASPNRGLSREEAALLLGRNMMLQPGVGEVLQFNDGRNVSDWSRGMVQAVAEAGMIGGYPDGTFRPQNKISRGEVGVMLVKAIGKLIQEPGSYTLGEVYSNVTISTSGVTLKNTVVAGDLYLTGGIGLGDVLLENVTVLGKIIVSGAGESNKGDSSIILRNVTAKEMIVDSLSHQFVTVRAEGDTSIGVTSVRTSSYLEDITDANHGLRYIKVEGEEGTNLQIAGNIKELINLTPRSKINFARGTAAKITIDEKAVESVLNIDSGATVKELNLDVATSVTGQGDVDHVNVNAPGSTIVMLPDTITMRPGITANINGELMDSAAAAESSMDPKLQAGYPTAHKVAPTSAEVVFSTNKKGTVYWALTAVSDGSVSEEDLITPPAYAGKILKSGSVQVPASKTEVSSKITGLVADGSYYVSAVLVDARGDRSPVKVASFTTPDNSTPQFAKDYPYMSKITSDSGQVAVMSTKSCQLYWAVLPKGATAPTVKDFKTGAISGNLGYGSMEVEKNITSVFTANSHLLKELETYDLYLCLMDADGGKDSGVKKLSFTTVDGTPPVFLTEPTVNSIKPTSVGMISALNESGTIYWALVKQGEEYPKPMAGQTTKPTLDSDLAKLQVSSGMNALKSGKVNATANKDVTINVSGLEPQSAYDLYYLAQDKAGNYSDTVKMITIHTQDTQAPVVTQEFTKTGDQEGKEPMPDTDVKIVFSEGIQDDGGEIFLELYQTSQDQSKPVSERDAARLRLAELLREDVKLYDSATYPHTLVPEKDPNRPGDVWIDYRDVEVFMKDGSTIFLFKNGKNLSLSSGGTYYFEVSNIADTSNAKNMIKPNPQKLPEFTTVFAEVNLTNQGLSVAPNQHGQEVRVDMSFQMHPVSTGSVDDSIFYDVFLWSNSIIKFDIYARIVDEKGTVQDHKKDDMLGQSGNAPDGNGWVLLGNMSLTPDTSGKESVGASVHRAIAADQPFPQLNSLKDGLTYEYAISLTQVGTLTDPSTWSDRVTIGVTIPAGPEVNVGNLSTLINQSTWKEYLELGLNKGGVNAIGDPDDFEIFKQFTDTKVPSFATVYPTFDPGDAFVTMHLQLDRPGTIYYAIAPIQKVGGPYQPALETKDNQNPAQNVMPNPGNVQDNTGKYPPLGGGDGVKYPQLSAPVNLDIYQPNFSSSRIKTGTKTLKTGIADVRVDELEPETIYYAYFVLKGNSQNLSDVYCLQFTTQNVKTPVVTLNENSPRVDVKTTTPAEVSWILYAYDETFSMLNESFYGYIQAEKQAAYQKEWTTYFPNMDPASGNPANNKNTYQTPTVLDALLASMPGGKSVFDELANDIAREEVLGRIQGQITGGVEYAGRGELTLKENTPTPVDCTKFMTQETQYYFLAAARNTQGSIYGFKAVGNVHMPDKQPPQFLSSQTTLSMLAAPIGSDPLDPKSYVKGPSLWKADPSGYYYRGSVNIKFDEPIYQLILEPDGTKKLTKVTKDNIVSLLGNSGDITLEAKRDIQNIISLDFTGAKHGSVIYFFNVGTISDGNSNATKQTLTLVFDATRKTADGEPDPGWVATWDKPKQIG